MTDWQGNSYITGQMKTHLCRNPVSGPRLRAISSTGADLSHSFICCLHLLIMARLSLQGLPLASFGATFAFAHNVPPAWAVCTYTSRLLLGSALPPGLLELRTHGHGVTGYKTSMFGVGLMLIIGTQDLVTVHWIHPSLFM